MLHTTVLKIKFTYQRGNQLVTRSIDFEFMYEAPQRTNLIPHLHHYVSSMSQREWDKVSDCEVVCIDEKDISAALAGLVDIKEMYQGSSLYASPRREFHELLSDHEPILVKGVPFFLDNISATLTLSRNSLYSRELAIQNRKCPEGAFALAEYYKRAFWQNHLSLDSKQERRVAVSMNISATQCLAHGLQFIKGSDVDFRNYLNLDDFFNHLQHLRRDILNCDANDLDKQSLLEALIKNKTIEAIILEKEGDLNDFVCHLLKSTTFVKTLSINAFKMPADYVERLARVLRVNQSIKTLEFTHLAEDIPFALFQQLLNAVAENSNSRVTSISDLRVWSTEEEMVPFLEEYIARFSQLEYIGPLRRLGISEYDPAPNKKIDTLLLTNQERKQNLVKRAFVRGAAIGFFAQLGRAKDLGYYLEPFLTPNDAHQLRRASKPIAQESRAAESAEMMRVRY